MMRLRLLPRDPKVGWTPYAWLIYLVPFLVVGYFLKNPYALPVSIAAGAVFLPLYFRGWWLCGRPLLTIVVAITLVGMVSMPFNSMASVFFVYAAGFLGRAVQPKQGMLWIGGLLVALAITVWLSGSPPQGWIPGAVFTILIGAVNIHFADRERADARLQLAHEEVERLARTAERERIARDLHDVLGHTLSLVAIKSELAAKLSERDPERARQEIRDVERISREALSEVRQAVRGYRSLELAAEVSKAKLALAAAGVELELDGGPFTLAPEAESAAALALREAVTNVVRHARAARCRIRLERANGRFVLEVVDDGRGGGHREGSGLSGMRERVEAVGGSVEVDGSDGTRVRVELPLRASAEEVPRVAAQ